MTTKIRIIAGAALVAGLMTAGASHTTAQPAIRYTEWGSLQELEAGWSEDTMAVRHSAPMVNPGGCAVTNAGYATDPTDKGHSLFHTLLLSALLNRKEAALLVSGCVYGKPKVIAVKVH